MYDRSRKAVRVKIVSGFSRFGVESDMGCSFSQHFPRNFGYAESWRIFQAENHADGYSFYPHRPAISHFSWLSQ